MSASANGFPDAIEDALVLAHVPADLRDSCRRAKVAASASFLRSVRCASGVSGISAVTYSRAHSGEALRAYFKSRADNARVAVPTKSPCSRSLPSAGAWTRGGQMTHLERGQGRSEGRVLCYRTGSRDTIVWTDTPTKLLGEASAPASAWPKLYAWWKGTAGPEKESPEMAGTMAALGKYPDAIEKELLLAHIPPAIRKTCARTPVPAESSVFLRAVKCKQDSSGRSVIYEYAHSVTALRSFFVDRITGAGLDPTARQSCAKGATASGTWSRRNDIEHVEQDVHAATGRVLCHVGADGEELEWADWPLVMYAYAARPVAQRSALHDWWAMKAGPGPEESGGMGGDSSMS